MFSMTHILLRNVDPVVAGLWLGRQWLDGGEANQHILAADSHDYRVRQQPAGSNGGVAVRCDGCFTYRPDRCAITQTDTVRPVRPDVCLARIGYCCRLIGRSEERRVGKECRSRW